MRRTGSDTLRQAEEVTEFMKAFGVLAMVLRVDDMRSSPTEAERRQRSETEDLLLLSAAVIHQRL